MNDPEIETKKCSKCKRVKSVLDFHNDCSTKDGKHSKCKLCNHTRTNESRKRRRKEDPEYRAKSNQRTNEWYHANKESVKISAAERHKQRVLSMSAKLLVKNRRSKAMAAGYEFTITAKDINIPKFCPILGLELRMNVGGVGATNASPTIDRIDSSKGYIPGNVEVISFRANSLKGDATIEELEKIVTYLKSQKGTDNLLA
jgi:hypothetical protein